MKTIVFDLDGTLAESKQAIDSSMALLLSKLLTTHYVAIISGGSYEQFKKQIVSNLPTNTPFENLLLLPVTGSAVYRYVDNEWKQVHADGLPADQKNRIIDALHKAEESLIIKDQTLYGEKIEDRGTQITYSGLGQNASVEAKQTWDPDQSKRKRMVEILSPILAEFDIHIGGMTSIDITSKGVDKASGIRTIQNMLGTPISHITFVGDALFPGGNDYPATTTGAKCIKVISVSDTKKIITSVLEKENSIFRVFLKKFF
ncbi:MAG: hypothetical protein RLZZ67_296 [Candidatus Parcubacteria bacterium]